MQRAGALQEFSFAAGMARTSGTSGKRADSDIGIVAALRRALECLLAVTEEFFRGGAGRNIAARQSRGHESSDE